MDFAKQKSLIPIITLIVTIVYMIVHGLYFGKIIKLWNSTRI